MVSTPRLRRTVLSVPASGERMLAKARGLDADNVMLDLEDAVAPSEKPAARDAAAVALGSGAWAAGSVSVRVNGWATAWTYLDVVEVVGGAGGSIDTLVLPKVSGPDHVTALDLLLSQVERASGLPVGGIGLELQVEDAASLVAVDAIAAASPRTVALVLGPADLAASLGARTGFAAGDTADYALQRILVAARAHGLLAIDGPFLDLADEAGLRTAKQRTAALGYDGSWCIHPRQLDVVREAYTPTPAEVDAARTLLDAYGDATRAGRGAAAHEGLMLDEASAAMARSVLARAAGPSQPTAG